MGRKPVGADPEKVYRTYLASEANVAHTARIHNLPAWKVYDWRDRYGWRERFVRDTEFLQRHGAAEAAAMLSLKLTRALTTLSDAMDQAETWKDRTNAAKAMLDYHARIVPSSPSSFSLTLIDARKLEDARRLGGSEMIESTAREILEANILDATEAKAYARRGSPG